MFFDTHRRFFMNAAYKRVSTERQDDRRQDFSFESYRIDKIYNDKTSGKNLDRPGLNKLMLELKKGDHLYVESISRLGRNVDDLRKITEYFKDKGVIIHFIKEGFSTDGNMYKFLLTILGAVAEMERELMVERIREGMKKAALYGTKSGNRIGRPPRSVPRRFEKYYVQWKNKEITAVEFAKLLDMSRSTLYRYINLFEKNL